MKQDIQAKRIKHKNKENEESVVVAVPDVVDDATQILVELENLIKTNESAQSLEVVPEGSEMMLSDREDVESLEEETFNEREMPPYEGTHADVLRNILQEELGFDELEK